MKTAEQLQASENDAKRSAETADKDVKVAVAAQAVATTENNKPKPSDIADQTIPVELFNVPAERVFVESLHLISTHRNVIQAEPSNIAAKRSADIAATGQLQVTFGPPTRPVQPTSVGFEFGPSLTSSANQEGGAEFGSPTDLSVTPVSAAIIYPDDIQ